MADKKSPRTPITLSPEALFRYQIISAVKARELSGQGMDAAVREVAAQQHVTLDGKQKSAAVRSIYRWLAELDRDGAQRDRDGASGTRDLASPATAAGRLPHEGEGGRSLRLGPRAHPPGP